MAARRSPSPARSTAAATSPPTSTCRASPDGTLTASATLTDAEGNASSAGTDTATKDTGNPSVTAFTCLPSATPSNSTSFSCSVTFSETPGNDGFDSTTDVTIGGTSSAWTVGASSGSGTGPYTFTVSRSAPDTDGSLTIQVAAGAINDATGNSSDASSTLTYTIDTAAPAAPTVDIVPGSVNNANKTAVSISISGEIGATITGTVTSSGGGTPVVLSGTIDGAGNFTTDYDLSGLDDGTLTASATLTDAAGNTSPAGTDTATKDTGNPSVTSFTCLPATTPSNSTTFTCSVSFSDTPGTNAFDSTADVTIGGSSSAWTVGASSGSGTGPYTFTVSRGAPDTDGTLTIQIAAGAIDDAGGNSSDASSVITYTIDTDTPNAPTVSIDTDPINNANQASVSISITGEVGTTVSGSVTSDGGPGSVALTGVIPVGGTLTASYDLSSLPDGTLTASATLTDGAGNTSSAGTDTASKDTVAPGVTLTSPADGSTVNTRTPSFAGAAGTAAGDSSTITVRIYAGSDTFGTLLQTLTTTAVSGAYSVPSAMLVNGVYTAQAQQDDSAGNPRLLVVEHLHGRLLCVDQHRQDRHAR